jgi:hypothetical protein
MRCGAGLMVRRLAWLRADGRGGIDGAVDMDDHIDMVMDPVTQKERGLGGVHRPCGERLSDDRDCVHGRCA